MAPSPRVELSEHPPLPPEPRGPCVPSPKPRLGDRASPPALARPSLSPRHPFPLLKYDVAAE